jgi:hypothetical protein
VRDSALGDEARWRGLAVLRRLGGAVTMATIELKCKDDPEANGRIPQRGEQRFTLLFPLENGDDLKVYMGRESMNHFETFIAQMMVEDSNEV